MDGVALGVKLGVAVGVGVGVGEGDEEEECDCEDDEDEDEVEEDEENEEVSWVKAAVTVALPFIVIVAGLSVPVTLPPQLLNL